ncbi:MAG: cysteine desulfurase NifS [Dehalococcoidia bacterium]|nr:cysteine desulfurase NifS [Dehalococcoidia bacterium]
MPKKIYLDYAATTPVAPEVQEAMMPFLGELFGNPSSVHSAGQEPRVAVERAREKIAELIGARSEEIVFTSGGTEADNTALEGVAFANRARGNHLITSTIEHHAVLECCRFLESQGFVVTYLPVDRNGLVDPAEVEKAIRPETILVSVMLANNEVGTIQPVSVIADVAKRHGIYCHTDAVQAVGHIPVDVSALGVDLLSISAHKLCGPKGVGALFVRHGTRLTPFLHGGSQERGRRASTENVPGIAGFGQAAELAQVELPTEMVRLTSLRDRMLSGLQQKITDMEYNGDPVRRLPGNVNISLTGVSGEAMLLKLDLAGICASTGSACNSESIDPSHVLRAMGISAEQAQSSLRLTLGKWTTEEEVDRTVAAVAGAVSTLRAAPPAPPSLASVRPGRFNGDAVVLFPDAATSIKGAGVLKEAGIENKLVAPPPALRMGCDLALEIYLSRRSEVEQVFNEKGVNYSRIVSLT